MWPFIRHHCGLDVNPSGLDRPADIPGIVAFPSSDDADFITGQVISVSGGLTMHG